MPRGYSQAVEDFAEFYEAYRNAEQQDARGPNDLQPRYPERCEFLITQVLSREF